MTEAEQKKLNGFLSKTLKMDDEELASLYNEAGELTSLTAAIRNKALTQAEIDADIAL